MRRLGIAALVSVGVALWIAALLLMAQTVQNSTEFSRLQPWILLVNAAGLVVLLALIVGKLVQLLKRVDDGDLGSGGGGGGGGGGDAGDQIPKRSATSLFDSHPTTATRTRNLRRASAVFNAEAWRATGRGGAATRDQRKKQ